MSDNRFLDALEQRVLLGSGAMGTELRRRGALLDRPVDELNLTRPQMVLDLSLEYARAGAELIKTNTFLANRRRVGKQAREINAAGARIARDAAKGGFVAGCVGPTKDLGPPDFLVYREQCRALAEGGCDLILLETFTDGVDLRVALRAAWSAGLPVVAQMARLPLADLTDLDADVIGVNCVDPYHALPAIAELRTPLVRSAFPSAGLPGKEIAPREFGLGIRRLVEAGARLVGGCCGAGPEYIAAAAAEIGRGR